METFSRLDYIFAIISIILILGWLVAISIYLSRLLKNYTLKDWGDKENPYKFETLGLPRGTLRGVLTLTLLIVVVILVCTSMLVKPMRGCFDSLIDAFQVMLAFYFGSKVMHHVTSSDKKKAENKNQAKTEQAKVSADATKACCEEEKYFNDPESIG